MHLSYNPRFVESNQKLKEVKNLIDFVKNHKRNFMIIGDFNVIPESKTIKEIEKYLKNCGPDYGAFTWTTKPFEYEGFKETEFKWRFDYAFCTFDVKVKSVRIGKTEFSDHLPLIIEIDLSN